MASAIEAELSKATKIKPKKGELRPEYLIRVWDAACDVKDSVWDTLSAPAAEWVNDITLKNRKWRALTSGKPNGKFVPVDFPDAVAEEEEEEKRSPLTPLRETLPVSEVLTALEESKKPKAKGPKPEPEEDGEEEPDEPKKPKWVKPVCDFHEIEEEEEEEKRSPLTPLRETLPVSEVLTALEESKKPKAKGPKPEPEEDGEEEPDEPKKPVDEVEEVLRTKESEPKHEPKVAAAGQSFEDVLLELAKTSAKKATPQPDYEPRIFEPRLNVQSMVRHMVIDNPNVKLDVLHRNIEDQVGETVSLTTVRSAKSWFKAALRDLERKDCLSKAFKAKLKLPSV